MFLVLRGSVDSHWLNYNKSSEVTVSVLIIARLWENAISCDKHSLATLSEQFSTANISTHKKL